MGLNARAALTARGPRNINRRGIIFTIDVVVGVIIVFIALAFTLFFINRAGEVSGADHQLMYIGNDVMRVLDTRGTLESLDYDTIETELYNILPPNYDMLLRIQGTFSQGNGTIEIGGELPERHIIIAGERAAYLQDDVAKVTYFIWPRN